MPGITGMGTTYNMPQYVGDLFSVSPEDTPLLSAIGGLTGGESVESTLFTWQTTDLREPDDDRQRTEGADAPEAEERTKGSGFNVLEIHQESVELSYTKQSASRMVLPANGATNVWLNGAVSADSLLDQVNIALKQTARDVELSFIRGTFQMPADNSTPRKTRGLLQAIPTANRVEVDTFNADALLDLMQIVWEEGGLAEGETRTILTGSVGKRALTNAFVTEKGYWEQTRNVGGVNLQTIETDFGVCNIMLDRWMPQDRTSGAFALAVVSLEELRPAFLNIAGKGHFFIEPLAKTGASDKSQLYGEIGLNVGNARKHGLITVGGVTVPANDTDQTAAPAA